ncbi:MAG: hypothetical protein IJS47_06580 [Clostridia bacterium]|nr:hypothetical protein [Clostridia bacterium]
MSTNTREAITEVLDILDHMDKEHIAKIPKNFLYFLKKHKSNVYQPQFDHTKKLCDLNLKDETKIILKIILQKYWQNS